MNDQFLIFHRPLIEVLLLFVILGLLLKTVLLLSFALLVDFGEPDCDTIQDFENRSSSGAISRNIFSIADKRRGAG
jgi:hypothetical protein